jgi:hypothetical protein
MEHVLQNSKTKRYFKGYAGTGKSLGNKPTWTDDPMEAEKFSIPDAIQMKKRLVCQCQSTRLIKFWDSGVAYPAFLHETARKVNNANT